MTTDEPIAILFVGTDHLVAWDGLTGPDVFDDERQRQLADAVDALAVFEPDRIMVEVMHESQGWLERVVIEAGRPGFSWTADDRQRSEVVQLGVRLAVRTGASAHAVDADSQLDWAGVESLIASNPEAEISALSDDALDLIADHSAGMEERTIIESLRSWAAEPLRSVNDREYLDRFLLLGLDDDAPGVDLVASWWKRNLRIFANITATAAAGDRVIVIFGSGHVPSLEVFADLSARFDVVPLAEVL